MGRPARAPATAGSHRGRAAGGARRAARGHVRADGTPRLSPVEPFVLDGDLWLSMMLGSLQGGRPGARPPRPRAQHRDRTRRRRGRGQAARHGSPDTSTRPCSGATPIAVSEALPWSPEVGKFHLFSVDIEQVTLSATTVRPATSTSSSGLRARETVRRGTSATSLGDPSRGRPRRVLGSCHPVACAACSPSCPRWPTRSRPVLPSWRSSRPSSATACPGRRTCGSPARSSRPYAGEEPCRRRSPWSTGSRCIGLDDAALEQVANRDDVVKVSTRDLATLVARKGMGATTVAATSHLAALAGIGVFATGGLGGVHRDARSTWDESADLQGAGDHRHHDRVRRREVDPGRAGHPRAAGDVGGDRPRLRHRRVPRLLPQRLRLPRSTGGSTPPPRSPR